MNITHFSIALITVILDFNIIPDQVDAAMIFIALVPTSFRFGSTFRRYIVLDIELLKQENIVNPTILDLYVRAMYDLTNLDYHRYC
jgi:hypothetical protein